MNTVNTSDSTLDEMDALLDGTLDDLADIPEFRNYPIGAHKVKLDWDLAKTLGGVYNTKEVESSGLKKFVEMQMVAIETVELPAGSTDTPLKGGEKAQMLFDLKNEFAQGKFKKVMAALAQHYGSKSNRELLADSKGAEVVVVIKHREDKKSGKTYIEIDNVMVV
jgi:hypothetical protein